MLQFQWRVQLWCRHHLRHLHHRLLPLRSSTTRIATSTGRVTAVHVIPLMDPLSTTVVVPISTQDTTATGQVWQCVLMSNENATLYIVQYISKY